MLVKDSCFSYFFSFSSSVRRREPLTEPRRIHLANSRVRSWKETSRSWFHKLLSISQVNCKLHLHLISFHFPITVLSMVHSHLTHMHCWMVSYLQMVFPWEKESDCGKVHSLSFPPPQCHPPFSHRNIESQIKWSKWRSRNIVGVCEWMCWWPETGRAWVHMFMCEDEDEASAHSSESQLFVILSPRPWVTAGQLRIRSGWENGVQMCAREVSRGELEMFVFNRACLVVV